MPRQQVAAVLDLGLALEQALAVALPALVLPFMIRMSGVLYLACAIILSGMFVWYAWQLYRNYSDALSRKLFRFSILYL